MRLTAGEGQPIGVFRTIVGVAGDVRDQGLDQAARATFYFPIFQFPNAQMHVTLRSAAPSSRRPGCAASARLP